MQPEWVWGQYSTLFTRQFHRSAFYFYEPGSLGEKSHFTSEKKKYFCPKIFLFYFVLFKPSNVDLEGPSTKFFKLLFIAFSLIFF
jgi:hypothetical protein